MKLSDKMWLAGFLEGEGCFYTDTRRDHSTHPEIRVSSSDLDVLQKAATLLGARIYELKGRRSIGKYKSTKRMYQAYVYGDPAVGLMKLLRPHMGKRRQAKIDEILERHDRIVQIREDRGWNFDSDKQGRSARKGLHVRWHVNREQTKSDCEWCIQNSTS